MPFTPLIQCVPNFSEGRRPEVVNRIVQSVSDSTGVRLVDWSADVDHNRMVVTFVGEPKDVLLAAFAAAETAVATIDIRSHRGVHPRLGAIDVLPLVPLTGLTMDDCASLARSLGTELSERLGLPVFLYEAASERANTLPFVRAEAFRALAPDFGPGSPHPTAGAVVVGARAPLLAYNINFDMCDITVPRTIARELREGGAAGFLGIRALGFALASRGLTQVSMNITRPAETSLYDVFTYVSQRAAAFGATVVESEVIGALPGFTAFDALKSALKIRDFKPGQVLWENWPQS